MTEMAQDQLITDRQVAATYGINRGTVWRWVEKGLIPGPVENRHRYTRWSQLEIQQDIRDKRERARQETAN